MGGFAGIKLVPVSVLRPHEQIIERHVEELVEEISSDGVLRYPVYVDVVSKVILDGHHRTEALRRLGARRIPAVLVRYFSSEIKVKSWREGRKVTKGEVIYRGLAYIPFPPKTSRHVFPERIKMEVPLDWLR